MPSASPSRPSLAKRPSVQPRSASTYSLSSSGKPVTANAQALAGATKQPRPHLVSRHSKNVSHGRGVSNMPKKSMSQVYGDGRHHRRVKSGTATPSASPKTAAAAHMKRNSSHVVLPKNRSAGNLRKNHSATTLTALNRNLSRGALNKLGAPAEQKAKQEQQQKQGVFDLGNASSEEEEEAAWEDSTASPELTRNNSKVSTPARSHTPNGEPIQKPPEQHPDPDVPEKTSSPPEPAIVKNNRSAPNLRYERAFNEDRPRNDPALLQPNGRSRAPPAMSTATAHSSQQNLDRSDSQRSLLKSSRTSLETSQDNAKTGATSKAPTASTTPGLGTGSSGSAGISHFLTNEPKFPRTNRNLDASDTDESVSDFMATYKPQPSESPEKPRTNINRARVAAQPSRTQQKLELQRREVMRGGGPPTPSVGLALSVGSSVSVHSRSASKGRSRSLAGEYKAIKQDYENAVKQLTVVRRFRNPVLESLNRLKQTGAVLSNEYGPGKADHKRPLSRHGRITSQIPPIPTSNGAERNQAGTGTEYSKTVAVNPTAHRDSRVSFQLSRQGSHDDILTASAGSPEAHRDDLDDGLSPREALIRRMWESRIHVA